MELFSEAVNSPWLLTTPVLLFLNKRDLFEKKFVQDRIPLNKSGKFPSAPTNQDNPEEAIEWITKQFKNQRNKDQAELYVHVTTATDPENVRAVFNVAKNTIIKANMRAAGF